MNPKQTLTLLVVDFHGGHTNISIVGESLIWTSVRERDCHSISGVWVCVLKANTSFRRGAEDHSGWSLLFTFCAARFIYSVNFLVKKHFSKV